MTLFIVHANLDCEARWAGGALPRRIEQRVSLYAALVAALAPPDREVEVWAPAAVDPAHVLAQPGTPFWPPAMRAGTPPRADLAWAAPGAKAVNDRRLALAVAQAQGVALPGARVIDRAGAIDLPGPWVVKAPWTTAGRDRCRGAGPPTPEQRTRVDRLLASYGDLVLEPWCERLFDVGVCATVAPDGAVTAQPAHGLHSDARGTFAGIDLAPPPLEPAEHAQLAAAVAAAAAALAARGHAGAFAIDAFVYHDASGARRFHPLCEINARYSFGWVARALGQRFGATRLGFTAPPPSARVLVDAGDGVTAWIA